MSRNIGISLLVDILGSTLFMGANINPVFALWKHLNSREIRVIDMAFTSKKQLISGIINKHPLCADH